MLALFFVLYTQDIGDLPVPFVSVFVGWHRTGCVVLHRDYLCFWARVCIECGSACLCGVFCDVSDALATLWSEFTYDGGGFFGSV